MHYPKKILIVEDELELAELLEYALTKAGFKPLVANDGLSACRLAGSEQPDLILLDIMLPDLDGWEICRLIRGHHRSKLAKTPIVMLTALSSASDRRKGMEFGADAYLTKPYTVKEVIRVCREMVSNGTREPMVQETTDAAEEREGGGMKSWSAMQSLFRNTLFQE